MYGVLIAPVLSTYHDPRQPCRGIQACDIRGISGKGLTIIPTETIIVEGHPVDLDDSPILAMYLFLQQEWVETPLAVLPRSFRRKLERERKPLPEVKTVVLRRAAQAGEGHETEGSREYSCQWIVSGHWRKHWFPKEKTHKPLYIAPYPKGPADKPLRTPRPTVYVAKR